MLATKIFLDGKFNAKVTDLFLNPVEAVTDGVLSCVLVFKNGEGMGTLITLQALLDAKTIHIETPSTEITITEHSHSIRAYDRGYRKEMHVTFHSSEERKMVYISDGKTYENTR